MKKGVSVVILFALAILSLSAYAQFPEIYVKTDAVQDKALISWTTENSVTTSLEINERIYVFGPGTSFTHEELNLDSAKEYKYKIIACSETYCSTHKSAIQTEGSFVQTQVTGNIILGLGEARVEIYYFLIALLGLTMVFISYRNSQPDVQIKNLLENSESNIRKGSHEKAAPLYKKALGVYKNLNTNEKARNYHRLVRVYNHLSLNQKQKEAKTLTEKYRTGTISQQELMRLRQLLTE